MNIDLIIDRYVKLRDKKAVLKAAFDASVADITTAMTRCENVILEEINTQGVESVRTAYGTAFKSVFTSVTTADGEMFLKFCVDNDRMDLLEKRPNKTAVEEYKSVNDDLPPGINYRQAVSLSVRRA
jgi:guanylate kinase